MIGNISVTKIENKSKRDKKIRSRAVTLINGCSGNIP